LLTIRAKIILSSSIVFSLTLVIFALWLYRSTRQSEYAKLDARMQSLAEEVQSEIEEEINDGFFPDSVDLNSVKIEGLPQAFVQIFDTTGNLVSGNPLFTGPTKLNMQPGFRFHSVSGNIKIGDKPYRSIWSPVEVDEKYPYILQTVAPLSEVNANLGRLKILLTLSIPLAILISAIAIYLITTLAFRPLSEMAVTAQRISATNLDERLKVPHAKDELNTLSVTLNQMFERLESAFQNQRQFVADASHEIRTPLTIMYTELEYARNIASEPEVVKSIDSCLEEIDRLGRMSESLLLLARLDNASLKVQKRLFRLDELIIEVVQRMTNLAQPKSIMINPFIENAIEINSDIDLIRQALIIIIDNAIKYSTNGGEVSIHLHSPADPTGRVEILIKDNGPGISDTELKKIFKRFYRGENARQESNGSGLGLPIAKMLISVLDGNLDLKSTIGKGTEVSIMLPLA
jgi:two-component system sensor histidine kinase ArlS